MSPRLSRAGAAVIALFITATATASVVVAHTLEQMAAASALIVRGKVGQVQARWDEGHQRIHTYAELRVADAVKGAASGIILVRQPGGEVGPIGQRVSGAARFQEGEEVVLFLEPAPDEPGVFGVWGLAAGKVTFQRSKVGELRAVRNLEGLAFQAPSGKSTQLWTLGQDDFGTPDTFLSRVRAAVRR